MSAAGDLASHCYVQSPVTEWAAARPFVSAFRTCAENMVVATDQVHSNQVRFTGQIGNQCPPENHPDRLLGNTAATTFCYGTRSCPGAMPRTTYRNLRTCLSLSLGPKTRRPTHTSPSLRIPWIRVVQTRPAAAAQRGEGTVRSDLGLKYRAYSLTVTKGSKFADDY
jgi:hypothetical protein